MKLVDILARELKEWPNDQYESIGQANDGALHKSPNWDSGCGWSKEKYTMAEDWSRVHVTRTQWQAAVDALKPEKKQREAISWTASPEWAKDLAINPHGVSAWLGDVGYVYLTDIGRLHEWSDPSNFPRDCFRVVESRPVVWDGEGSVPTAGAEFEFRPKVGVDREWTKAKAKYVGDRIMIIQDGDGEGSLTMNLYDFRPILTPEQVAKQERSMARDKMFGVILDKIPQERRNNGSDICEALYDAGYRKLEIVEG